MLHSIRRSPCQTVKQEEAGQERGRGANPGAEIVQTREGQVDPGLEGAPRMQQGRGIMTWTPRSHVRVGSESELGAAATKEKLVMEVTPSRGRMCACCPGLNWQSNNSS